VDPVSAEGEFTEVETRKFGDSLCLDLRGDGLQEHVAIYLGMGLCIHVHRSRGIEVIPVRNLEGKIIATYRIATDDSDH
jgi:cell wall-associated NlpC family hydrolase